MGLSRLQLIAVREMLRNQEPRDVREAIGQIADSLTADEWAHACSLLEAAADEAKMHGPAYDPGVTA